MLCLTKPTKILMFVQINTHELYKIAINFANKSSIKKTKKKTKQHYVTTALWQRSKSASLTRSGDKTTNILDLFQILTEKHFNKICSWFQTIDDNLFILIIVVNSTYIFRIIADKFLNAFNKEVMFHHNKEINYLAIHWRYNIGDWTAHCAREDKITKKVVCNAVIR